MAYNRKKVQRKIKRDSQRQFRNIASSVLNILEKVKDKFPSKNERYFEI